MFAGSSTDSGAIEGLLSVLATRESFFKNVDYIGVSGYTWLGITKPCIGYAFRGCCFFYIEITCGKKDLHSGKYGGAM